MKKDTGFLWVLWIFITLVGLLHLVRVFLGWDANIGLWQVPLWLSSVAFVVLAYFSYRLYVFLKK